MSEYFVDKGLADMGVNLVQAAPTKVRVNVTVNSKLVDEARALNINMSRVLEERLEVEIKSTAAARWLEENEPLLAARREWTEKNGTFGDKIRAWKVKHGAV